MCSKFSSTHLFLQYENIDSHSFCISGNNLVALSNKKKTIVVVRDLNNLPYYSSSPSIHFNIDDYGRSYDTCSFASSQLILLLISY